MASMRVIFRSGVALIYSTGSNYQHFIRKTSETSSSAVKTTKGGSGYWSQHSITVAKSTSYTVNGSDSSGNYYGGWTFSHSTTLASESGQFSTSSTTSSITIKLTGWAMAADNTDSYPNLTITLNGTSKTLSLSTWINSGHTWTGLTSGKSYTAELTLTDTGWSLGSCTPSTKSESSGGDTGTTSHFYVYSGSKWVQATPYIYNGSKWVQATPYIHNGSKWVQGS